MGNMMASPKELPFNKPTTDFKLCWYCQTDTDEKLVDTQNRKNLQGISI